MQALALLSIWAALAGCAAWSAATDTRALGVPRQSRRYAWLCVALLLAGQAACAAAPGAADGLRADAAGRVHMLVLSACPHVTQRWARRSA